MNKPSQTDWDRIDALKDEEIDYAEIPDLGDDEAFWARAEVVMPVTIWVEPEVLARFKAQGEGYEARIDAILRAYKKAAPNNPDFYKSLRTIATTHHKHQVTLPWVI